MTDRNIVDLAHAVLDAVVPDVPWKIQLQEFQARAAAAPTLARAVIDLTAKVERMEALEAALENGGMITACSNMATMPASENGSGIGMFFVSGSIKKASTSDSSARTGTGTMPSPIAGAEDSSAMIRQNGHHSAEINGSR